jgi:hypothetical protein
MSDAAKQPPASKQPPAVSASQMLAAGLASASAAIITSKFGVAGTLLGAALTTMIITGGSAILKAYLESVTGQVRKVPRRLRERQKAGRYAEPSTIPGRPDLLNNFAGRLRAALGWFSHLPPLARRSILIKGLIAAAAAFVIGMGTVYAFERVIGNSLSCGLWDNCPEGASPGIHIGGGDGTGAGSTIAGGRAKLGSGADPDGADPDGGVPDGGVPDGGVLGSDQGAPLQGRDPIQRQDPGYQPPAWQRNPSGSNVEPVDPNVQPTPVEPEIPAEDPVVPGSGNQTPEQPAPGGGTAVPGQDDAPVGVQTVPAQ